MPAQQANSRAARRILEVRQLAFRTDSRILWSDVNIDLREGERLAIAGPSGSGKTLLLRVLAGLEPIQSGQVLLDGQSIESWFMPEYRRQVLYVQQKPALREGTVQGAIEAPFLFRIHHGVEPPMDQIRHYLRTLGRGDAFLAQRTEHLSGGELQIVAVLRALAVGPSILMLDEPTASLDVDVTHKIEQLVAQWLDSDSAHASIWTSHDPEQLGRVSDSVLNLALTS